MRYIETLDAVPVGELESFPGNARVHAEAVLAESAQTNGQYRSIVARRHNGGLQILAGHGTRAAFAAIGTETVRVEVIECDDDEAARIVLVDNRGNDLAGYDERALLDLLKTAQPDLTGTGFDQAAFDALVAELYEAERLTDPDDAPPVPAAPRSVPGDVWLLGEHRLVCGDATDEVAAKTVLAGVLADCMWTDPPYGVEYVGGTKDKLTIKNDSAAGLPGLLAGAFAVATGALAPGAPVYVAHPAVPLDALFRTAFVEAGWLRRGDLVWVKDRWVLGRTDYHYGHEPILYGFTPGATGKLGRAGGTAGGSRWYGENAQSSVLTVDRPTASKLHPTMKPVELIVRCLNNSVRPGGIVYDPFGGSGSTLVAAHLTGRKARLIELDPGYVDVIATRWQTLTGVVPILESSGEAVDFGG